MSRAAVSSSCLRGVEAVPVEVQADLSSGLPCFTVVGLGDTAVLESRDRVRSAIRSSGYDFPSCRIVVNLAPAPLRKHGTGLDLPIAVALLRAGGQMPDPGTTRFIGELSLDGTVRAVPGCLVHAMSAAAAGETLACAPEDARVAAAVPGLSCAPVTSLSELRAWPRRATVSGAPTSFGASEPVPDIAEVHGHQSAKRVLEIAAAGDHGLLFVGPPGSGKTLLARRLPGLLPPLGDEERLETACVHSVAGTDPRSALAGIRPFRAPHHSASLAGLIGGGSPARPGEIALAHNGVLFLDELPEFGPSALQALRQPMEDGRVTLVRADGRVVFPARFALVAAMNPCPCGYSGDRERACRCAPGAVERYLGRVGGPLLDRIDLFLRVERIDPARMLRPPEGPTSAHLRTRIARVRSASRTGAPARLSGTALLRACGLGAPEERTLLTAARSMFLSGRAITRLLRVSRTIASLAGSDRVTDEHLLEALCYRDCL